MKEITKAELIRFTEHKVDVIEWEGSDGFGSISFKYTDDGKYIVNAEYLDIESIIKIIKKVEL